MFSALGNLLKVDERHISLFEHAPKQYTTFANTTGSTPTSSSELSKIDELKQRTLSLSLQHEENSRKALLDEAIITSREESAQLMQLSLRMLLDVVDRQSEVAHLDLAKTLYGDRRNVNDPSLLPSSNPSNASTSLVSRALDVHNGGAAWKQKTLQALDSATRGLLTTSQDQDVTVAHHDEKLLASRQIMAIIAQLSRESKHAKLLGEDDFVRKQINVQHDAFMKSTNHPHRSLLGLSTNGKLSKLLSKTQLSSISSKHKTQEEDARSELDEAEEAEEHSPSNSTFMTSTGGLFPSRSPSSPMSLEPLDASLLSPSSSPTKSTKRMLSSSSTMGFTKSSTPMIETTKIRGVQAKLSQKLIKFGEHKSRWSQILINELKPFQKKAKQHITQFQSQWCMLIALTAKTSTWGNVHLANKREEIADEKAKVQAVIRMQSMFRGGFERSLFDKFQQVQEMLMKRLWIIRLNIHTKKRKREAGLVRQFLNDYANVNPFKIVVSKFRWKIIWTQR